MDFLIENVQNLLQAPAVSYLRTTTQEQVTTHLSNLRTTYMQPYIITPISTFLSSTSGVVMPDLLSIFLLALILIITLKVLDYARRVIMFWVSLAFRLVFWATLLSVAWYIYRVGLQDAGRDFGWAWGLAEGFVQDFQARTAAAAAHRAGGVPEVGAGSGSAWGSGSGKGYARGR
ncbi:Nuclear pore assembly and biogenesis protein APQ12 [Penicillium taxi]|uniref:Nuclear pore assembly and biogenesis protein APQ12 n=1 Tax=Penicillium taxi TaxID=168475 RepID=UPI0025458C14|nr:Nuclear pore assembly and biogenesis protein APQ12 [Penicillium taxi]KAJ5894004.1 Nuclear pore assembly and biogenesis protein APQ12 [Penicillium taxi]